MLAINSSYQHHLKSQNNSVISHRQNNIQDEQKELQL